MSRHIQTMAGILAAVVMLSGVAMAQAPGAASPPPRESSAVPLKLLVVLSKYQGEKKITTLPYTLSLVSNGARVSLRMGGEVPVLTGAPTAAVVTYNYRNVGTSIDCSASSLEGGRFSVNIVLDDSSVYAEGESSGGLAKAGDQPSFNTFRATETVILKDGQSSQYTTAADKITGQVVKVDLTLTVLK